jgi:hypothetical protein
MQRLAGKPQANVVQAYRGRRRGRYRYRNWNQKGAKWGRNIKIGFKDTEAQDDPDTDTDPDAERNGYCDTGSKAGIFSIFVP